MASPQRMMSRSVTTRSAEPSITAARTSEEHIAPADPEDRDGIRYRHLFLSSAVRSCVAWPGVLAPATALVYRL